MMKKTSWNCPGGVVYFTVSSLPATEKTALLYMRLNPAGVWGSRFLSKMKKHLGITLAAWST
jgi:hypothetical protein